MQKDESLSYIDVVFACGAHINKKVNGAVYADFLDERSAFLSDVYRCMGSEVTDVTMTDSGVLAIDLGSWGVISIEPALDEERADGWSWRFQFDKNFDIATLSCVQEGGRFMYFADKHALGQA
ncbi:hypothetical protein DYGSA30_14520 [Dyella sp. GSA-30]|nr:hypothetical protein DYGSA30_14520 [Dyella sp. GSA-30]